jgi:gamma-glutamyl-gamma-aminobutyrate hydrolase PuuD
MMSELTDLGELGMWNPEYAKTKCDNDSANCIYHPVIGILTQPVSKLKKNIFNYDDYILEVNNNFIKWGGSRTVAIPYNISNDDLLNLLPQINGVLFTGGALELIDADSGTPHPYYVTAKKIVMYSKYLKDVKNEDFPIMGICQGIEVIGVI